MNTKVKDFARFKNLPVFWKISFLPILAVGLVMLGMFFYALPLTKEKFAEGKRSHAADVVRAAYSIVSAYDQRVAKGEFSLEEAQKRAKESIGSIRFGNEDKECLWINDLEPKMIMHPIKPELEGKILSGEKDQNGKYIFMEMVKVCKEKGEGFVEFMWPKPGEANPSPKLSFAKLYTPWGWVIGSGIYVDDVSATVWKIFMGIGVMLIVISVLVTTTTFIVGGGFITGPVKEYGKMMQGLSSALSAKKGDLTGRLAAKGNDEIGSLAVDINKVLDSYGEMVEHMLLSAGRVVTTTDHLKDNINSVTTGAKKQASQAYRIAASAEEMSQTINDIAKNASEASDISSEARVTANKGRGIAQEAVASVEQVHTSTIELAGMIDKLNGKATEIGDIVIAIKDIADQTNLLALNAAIEAARAGEQGRGFAVVADQVKKLAYRTITATEEITEKIRSVQDEAARTTKSMGETAGEVTKANGSMKEVMAALEGITEAVARANDKVTQIATAVVEQSAAADEVAKSIEGTSQIAKETEEMTGDVLKGTDKIVTVVEDLRQSFTGFKTAGSAAATLEVAKSDIRSFMYKVGDYVNGRKAIDETDMPDDSSCRFGKWYDNEGREMLGHLASFSRLAARHEKIHVLAEEAMKAAQAKDGRASALYEQLTNAVKQIQADIDAIMLETRTEISTR